METIANLPGVELDAVEDAYRESYKPPVFQNICDWARESVPLDPSSPLPGNYDINHTLYMREPLETFQKESVREQITLGPNQGGRTKGMEVAAMFTIRNRPGPTQWNTDTNDKAKEHAEDRFWPVANEMPEVGEIFPADLDKKTTRKVTWANGYTFVIQGANLSNSQQKSVLNQFNDEIFQWKEGMLSKFHKRTTAYKWTAKIWDSSAPGDEGGQLEARWEASSQGEWSFRCPKCKKVQAFDWDDNMRWATNEKTKPGGNWDFEEVRKTVHMVCSNGRCNHRFHDDFTTRRKMNEGGCYVHKFPNRKLRGHRFNVLAVNWPGITWADWVVEFLGAKQHFKIFGDVKALKEFWTLRMVQFWEEGRFTGGKVRTRESDYSLGEPNVWIKTKWELGERTEWGRFLSCDKQEFGYPYVVRACMVGGESRMIETGVLASYEEIDEKADEVGIGQDVRNRVLIDCSHEMREVFAEAARRGWTCFRGSPRNEWTHEVKVRNTAGQIVTQRVRRPYAPIQWGDAGLGANKQRDAKLMHAAQRIGCARVVEWSNLAIKDMLAALKSHRASLYWGIPSDAPDDYVQELNGETRYRILNHRGIATFFWSNAGRTGRSRKRANHRWDCECQILCAMIQQGLIDLDMWQIQETQEAVALSGQGEDMDNAPGEG